MTKKKKVSKRSKQLDQKYVSVKELSKEQKSDLKDCVEAAYDEFDQQLHLWSTISVQFVQRLHRTAKRKKMSMLAYTEKYLLKK